MLEQALDFKEESDVIYALIEPLEEVDYDAPTQFKNWTANQILQHLHFFNMLADLSLTNEDEFTRQYDEMKQLRSAGGNILSVTDELLHGIKGSALKNIWRDYYVEMADRWIKVDPKKRLKWAGPSMSTRSSISARLMETWSHAQALFDNLGIVRQNTDRIKSVAVLGVNTFGWTFANRGEDVPKERPYVRLDAPSGEVWEWGETSDQNYIIGPAEDFCMVVTQTRNISDVNLEVSGEVATQWMAKAQCFAGVARDAPKPGTRFICEK